MKKASAPEPVRINRYLALCGIASRRAADRLVEEGRVMVNGAVVDGPGMKVVPGRDEVVVDGRRFALPEERKVYILLNKPRNAISTSNDERNRQTVLDLVAVPERIFPVGRLDRKTTGMLLLTNDGMLASLLMHPSSNMQKEYIAHLDTPMSPVLLKKLTGGMRLNDTGEKVSPCQAKLLEGGLQVWLAIHEGKNRQVHRMFETLGFTLKRLDRVAYAGLTAGELRRGQWRFLDRSEVQRLQRLARGS